MLQCGRKCKIVRLDSIFCDYSFMWNWSGSIGVCWSSWNICTGRQVYLIILVASWHGFMHNSFVGICIVVIWYMFYFICIILLVLLFGWKIFICFYSDSISMTVYYQYNQCKCERQWNVTKSDCACSSDKSKYLFKMGLILT